MKLKLESPKLLADVIALMAELVLEVKAKLNKEGLQITAIDPANVALCNLKIPATTFSEFQVEQEQELGLNLEDLKQVLKRLPDVPVVFEKEENLLKLKVQSKTPREFSLALLNVEAEEKEIPKLNFSTSLELDPLSFAEAIADAAIVADSCSFEASPEGFKIEARGTVNSAKATFPELKAKETKAKYSLDYLTKFIKAVKFAPRAMLHFGTNYPMQLDFLTEELSLSFVLAPRVEEE